MKALLGVCCEGFWGNCVENTVDTPKRGQYYDCGELISIARTANEVNISLLLPFVKYWCVPCYSCLFFKHISLFDLFPTIVYFTVESALKPAQYLFGYPTLT